MGDHTLQQSWGRTLRLPLLALGFTGVVFLIPEGAKDGGFIAAPPTVLDIPPGDAETDSEITDALRDSVPSLGASEPSSQNVSTGSSVSSQSTSAGRIRNVSQSTDENGNGGNVAGGSGDNVTGGSDTDGNAPSGSTGGSSGGTSGAGGSGGNGTVNPPLAPTPHPRLVSGLLITVDNTADSLLGGLTGVVRGMGL